MRVRRNACLLIGGNSVKYTVRRKRRREKPALMSKQVGAIFTILGGTSPCRGGTCGDNRFGGFPFGWFGALSTLGRPLQLSPSNLLTDVFANPSLWKLHWRDDNPWRCFDQLG